MKNPGAQIIDHIFSESGELNRVVPRLARRFSTPALLRQQRGEDAIAVSKPLTLNALGPRAVAVESKILRFTNYSGAIIAGGTSQLLFTSLMASHYMLLQNLSTGNLWFNFDDTATVGNAGSLLLSPNQSYETPANIGFAQACSIIGATTGQLFTCKVM